VPSTTEHSSEMTEVVKSALDEYGRTYGTGRRKTSVARVWIKEGSGQFLVNGANVIDYFQPSVRNLVLEPFVQTKTTGFFDIWCTVKGGGFSGIFSPVYPFFRVSKPLIFPFPLL
jgi:small subunit ribosomal protein S9